MTQFMKFDRAPNEIKNKKRTKAHTSSKTERQPDFVTKHAMLISFLNFLSAVSSSKINKQLNLLGTAFACELFKRASSRPAF